MTKKTDKKQIANLKGKRKKIICETNGRLKLCREVIEK